MVSRKPMKSRTDDRYPDATLMSFKCNRITAQDPWTTVAEAKAERGPLVALWLRRKIHQFLVARRH